MPHARRLDLSCMQVLNREHDVPVLTPYNVTVLYREAVEPTGVEVFVILRMRMATDVLTHIYRLRGAVAEPQENRQVSHRRRRGYVQSIIHRSYSFFFIVVLLTACLKTKNFTHLSMIFLWYFRMKLCAVFASLSESGSTPFFCRGRMSVNSPSIIMSSNIVSHCPCIT